MLSPTDKFYLTKEGLEKLEKEYKELQKIAQLKIKEKIPEIFHSEELNPEYLAYREDNELLQARLADLKYILKNVELIKTPPKEKQNIVNLGATVTVEVDGQKDEFQIVGTLEANPSLGKISNESPVGKALLGHKLGDVVCVQSAIKTVYKILKIKYNK
jgi:transcription elongation factor GreA